MASDRFLSVLNEPLALESEHKLAKSLELEDTYLRMLLKGTRVLKFGRSGSPHWKFLYVDLEGVLYWADTEEKESEVCNGKVFSNLDAAFLLSSLLISFFYTGE